MAKSKAEKSVDTPLTQFFGEFRELVNLIPREIQTLQEDADEKAVVQAFAQTLYNQVDQLSDYVLGLVGRSSKQRQAEVQHVLLVTSGMTLVKEAKQMLPSIGSVAGKLGLSRVVKELKKIIRLILDAIGAPLPRWMDGLLNLIDEILDAILSAGSAKMATTLSIQEQNYLAELTQLAKLQQANQFRSQNDDDDE